jgi:vancomycin permeability regulator SanA
MMSRVFYIHEDADDIDEFQGDTPKVALEVWLMHGATTSEFDHDYDGSSNIDEIVNREHTVFKMERVIIKDQEHLEQLAEEAMDDEIDWSTMKVGESFYRSVGHVKVRVRASLSIQIVPPNAPDQRGASAPPLH